MMLGLKNNICCPYGCSVKKRISTTRLENLRENSGSYALRQDKTQTELIEVCVWLAFDVAAVSSLCSTNMMYPSTIFSLFL
jgi:hypothetical protein